MGIWSASPNLPVKYTGESNAVLIVLNATLDVIDGGSFKYYGTYRTSAGVSVSARFSGKAVCADGYIDRLLISVDGQSCWTTGGAPWFCSSAPTLYAGVFSYGVSLEGGLMINSWGGAQWPFQFACASQSPSPPCQYVTSCNSTVMNNWSLNLYGGTSIVNGSSQTVVISGGDNSTVIFEGDTINVQNSEFTLEQPTSVNQTIINISPESNTYPTNTTILIQPQDATYYEFNTNEAASCSGFAQLDGVKTSNVTLSTASNTRITFDSSSLESPSDWSLSPDSSTLQFNSDNGYAYSIQVCLHSAVVYDPLSIGQRVLVYLYNRTGTPSAISIPSTSAIIYNHTNPAYVGGVCSGPMLVSRVYNGNRFAIYATIQFTDSSSGSLVLGTSAWTITATPMACVGTEINIDIEANFNNTQLEAGECINIDYPDAETVRVNNPGVCGVTVTNDPMLNAKKPTDHSQEGWFTHAFHTVKEVASKFIFGATSTLAGTITLTDTTYIKPRHIGSNNVEFQWSCASTGIDCGEQDVKGKNCTCDEVKSDGKCNCEQGVETEGTCSCESGVSANNGTCNCKQGVETEGMCNCDSGVESGGPLSAPSCNCDSIETNTISSETRFPVEFPTGARFGTPTPITITFDPRQPSVVSVTSTSTSSSSSSSSTTSNPNDPSSMIGSFSSSGSASGPSGPSGPTGPPGPCLSLVHITLRDDMPLEGIDVATGKKVKLLGSVLDSASSALDSATSAVSSATSAATSAATSGIRAVTGLLSSTLCGGTVGIGASLAASGGAPSSPSGSPPSSIGPDSYPSDLTGAVAAAAFASSGSPPPPGPAPSPGTTDAAIAAAAAAATLGSPVPPGSPTTLTVYVGGFIVPSFNDSVPLPPCSTASHRGQFGVLKGNGTSADQAIMCLDDPTKEGWGFYPFPTSERLVTDVFSGNGTGLVCANNYCTITAYPNGTLFSLDGAEVVLPGTCTFCSMQVDKYGRVIAFSSGNVTAYNRSFYYQEVLTYYSDSGIIMDENSTIINNGATVLNNVLITNVNVTGTARFGGSTVLASGSQLRREGCQYFIAYTNDLLDLTIPGFAANCVIMRLVVNGSSYIDSDDFIQITFPRSTPVLEDLSGGVVSSSVMFTSAGFPNFRLYCLPNSITDVIGCTIQKTDPLASFSPGSGNIIFSWTYEEWTSPTVTQFVAS
mgnify:CR=1 FL=1